MSADPLPAKAKFAAGLLALTGVALLLIAGVDAALEPTPGPNSGFLSDRGYEEGKGSDGYHFRYSLSGTGPGAERPVQRGVGALAGFGFLVYGVRLFLGSAVTVLPAAGLAVLVGIGKGVYSAQLARTGHATTGLPGMGLAFILVIAGLLLVAGRSEYLGWRRSWAAPRRTNSRGETAAGILLVVYGLAAVASAASTVGRWLKPVRGEGSRMALRAEVAASTGIEAFGGVLKSAAEKSRSFTPGTGYFLHPQFVGLGWGGVWAFAGLGVLLGRGSRGVGIAAVASAGIVTAFAALSLATALPWYAALPDGMFPGALALVVPGGLLLARSSRH